MGHVPWVGALRPRGSDQTGTFTLVQWSGSNDGFSANDFTFVNLADGLAASFYIVGGTLQVTIALCADAPPTFTLAEGPSLCLDGLVAANTSIAHQVTSGIAARYTIDFSDLANSAGFTDIVNIVYSASPFPYTIPGTATEGIYTGRVILINAAGCFSEQHFIVTIGVPPATPGSVIQVEGGSAACYASDTTSYTVADVAWATTYTWTVPATATILAGQGTPSGNVIIEVLASNDCGDSENTGWGEFEILEGPPGVPTLGDPTEIAINRFTINWFAPANPGGHNDVGGYRLDVSTASDFSTDFVVSGAVLSAASTSYALTGLSGGNTYFYRLLAYNACGISAYTDVGEMLTPQVLAGWDMSPLTGGANDFGTSPLAPQKAIEGVTIGGLTRGGGVGTTGTGAARGWGGTGWDTASAAAAITAGDYLTFTLVPQPNNHLSFYSIDVFDYRRLAAGPTSGTLQYSVNGMDFTTLGTGVYEVAESGASMASLPFMLDSALDLQDVQEGTTVTLRIINHGGSSGDWYIYDRAASTNYDFEIRGNVCSNPPVYSVIGGGPYCFGNEGAEVGLSGSTRGVTYRLYRDGGTLVTSVAGTGSTLSFGAQATAGTYTVKAIRNAGECESDMTGSAVVSISTVPDMPIVYVTNIVNEEEVVTEVSPITAAEINNTSVVLNWVAAAGTLTSYNIKRRASFEVDYTTIATLVTDTNYTDATAIAGNTYTYIVSAQNSACEGNDSLDREVVMPQFCPGGYGPNLAHPGNRTVNLGNILTLAVTASEVSDSCPAPSLSHTTLPDGMIASDETSGRSITRTYEWSPVSGQQGVYPITITATDAEELTTNITIVVYVGSFGESGNGATNAPPSQSTWHVAITNLAHVSGSTYQLTWQTDPGVAYTVYRSTNFPCSSWTPLTGNRIVNDTSNTWSLTHNTERTYLQVVPDGVAPNTNGIWGVFTPTIPNGFSMRAPCMLSDRNFGGAMGASLAEVLPVGTIAYIMTPGNEAEWITLELRTIGEENLWIDVDLGTEYSTPLATGQGYWLNRPSGTTAPHQIGPVGNGSGRQITLQSGFNIISVSEGMCREADEVFESADPVGSYDEQQADQIIILEDSGAWRRLIRRPNRTWKDTGSANPNDRGNTTYRFAPGQAYYYIRSGGSTTLDF